MAGRPKKIKTETAETDTKPKPKGTSSKVKKVEITNKLGEPTKCLCCGKTYPSQKTYFSPSYSQIYASNNGFLPVCRDCVNALLKKYVEELDDDKEAFKRICLHFDLYYSPEIYTSAKSGKGISFLMGGYFSRSNGVQYFRPPDRKEHKTYDDTVFEEAERERLQLEDVEAEADKKIADIKADAEKKLADAKKEIEELKSKINPDAINTQEDILEAVNTDTITVSQDTIKFFGYGFDDSEYKQLSDQFNDWIKEYECKDKSQKELLKNICIVQLQIQRSIKKGEKIESLMTSFNNLLSSAKLKSTDTKGDMNDPNVILGCWIKDIERFTPAEYYANQKKYADHDGILDYIQRFLFRPLKNLLTGSKDLDKEFSLTSVNDDDDDRQT